MVGGNPRQRVMGPPFVVVLQPFCADLAHLLQEFKHVGVQHFRPIGPITSFDERILIRFPRFNASEFDGPLGTPRHERSAMNSARCEPNGLQPAPPGDQLLQHADHALRRERGINLDRQVLLHAFIQNSQDPKPSVAQPGVAHKIRSPHRVGLRDDYEGLAEPDRQPPLRATRDIQVELAAP